MEAHVLASLGLLLDIVGAIWVVKGVIAGRDDELVAAADRSGFWSAPNVPGAPQHYPRPELLKILRDSRRDARIGAVLLVIGFAGQLLSQWI